MPAGQTPFNGTHSIPGTTQAEDFDNGGEGAAYHDQDVGNNWGYYRTNVDVDIQPITAASGGAAVGDARAGEWLEYTVNVTTAGSYDIVARVASGGPGGTFHYIIDPDSANPVITSQLTAPDTSAPGLDPWSNFKDAPAARISFTTTGPHIIRVALDKNGAQAAAVANFDYFQFVASSSSAPVGYWKFDESGGLTAADSSGNGNGATLQNGTSWAAGKVGSAVSFDGLDDYLQVGTRSNLVMTNAMTLSAWVYPTSAGNNGIIINKEGEYEIAIAGTVQWALANTNPGWAWINTGYTPSLNQWTHIALTYNNGVVNTYANGTLVHSYTGAGALSDVDLTQNDFRIGGRQCCAQYFQGRIDEVRVYNRALGATEVQALFSAGSPLYEGYHDGADCTQIIGWAWDQNQPNTPISVDIYSDNTLLSTVVANQFRQDLVNAGKGNGYHGFSFVTPTDLKDGQTHSITVKFAGTSTSLSNTPRSIICSVGSQPKIIPVAVTASSNAPGSTPQWAIDGDPTTFWNSGGFPPRWIEIDLGQNYSVSQIRLLPLQDIAGPTTHVIYMGAQPAPTAAVYIFNQTLADNQWVAQSFSPAVSNVRYVRVSTTAGPAWVCWREIELFGTPSGEGQPGPSDFSTARIDPLNRTGAPGEDLFSGNFNWSLPVLDLNGRADLDLGFSLSYNSLVWTKAGGSIKFNADSGFPGPGFRLGFPVIQQVKYTSQAGPPSYLMITPSGGHVELRQVVGTSKYESVDSSYLQFDEATGILRTPNGAQLAYAVKGTDLQCVKVTDRNGNFISIAYDGAGRILQVTDTLARTINFVYDLNGNLQAIWQLWNGSAHDWATFTYQSKSLTPSFSGLSVVAPSSFWALTNVRLADGSSYGFDYTSFGQVNRVTHYAADNHQLGYLSYDLDVSAGQTDCPRFTRRTDYAENWNTVTTYFVFDRGTGSGQATLPDNTVVREYHGTLGYRTGLTTRTDTISANTIKRSVSLTWEQDNDGGATYPKNPRVIETLITDDQNNRHRTTAAYTSFGLPSDVYEYDADAMTVLRRTHIDYNLSQVYLDRRILGLPGVRTVYDQSGAVVTKIAYSYDWNDFFMADTPATPTNHDASFGATFYAGRGNLCGVERWDASDPQNEGKAIWVAEIGYFKTGAPRFVRDANWHGYDISYADNFSDGVARNTFASPTTITDADGYSTTAQYNYDFGALTLSHDPLGAERLMAYDSAGRLTRQTYRDSVLNQTGTYTRFVYPTNQRSVQSYTLLDPNVETYSEQWFDGAGRLIATARLLPGSVGGRSGQKFIYDVMGRLAQKSNPTETSASGLPSAWVATGDDANAGWLYTTQAYDWKGRPTVTTYVDGSQRRNDYTGCGCAGGEVVTTTDEVNRQQKIYYDALGRQVKTETLSFDGTVYLTTIKEYNARDQVIRVVQRRANITGGQETTMTYDGHGRLQSHHLPEYSAGTSLTYVYNPDDTVQSITDPRGVVSQFTYNARRLMTNIDYIAPAPIPATAAVGLQYDAAGNRTRMTDGSGRTTYQYDTWSQLKQETREFNGLNDPVTGTRRRYFINYDYNLAGQLKKVTDPFGADVSYAYDQAGQLTTVSGSPFANVTQYARNMQYRAWGSLKHLDYGDNPIQLNLTYNSRLQAATMKYQPVTSGPDIGSWEYNYYADGHINYSRDRVNALWNRGYAYDHMARLTVATSGADAFNEGQSSGDYSESFGYNVWSNMTSRTGGVGAIAYNYTTTYANNRDQKFQYDAAGNVTRDDKNNVFTYDAAGYQVSFSLRGKSWVYDGDGSVAKWIQSSIVTYNLNSAVLGRVLTEIDGAGNKRRTFVYSGHQLLATQQQQLGQVWWEHRDASNTSIRNSLRTGDIINQSENEPLGVKANQESPETNPEPIARPQQDNPSTGCMLDGVDAPCSFVLHLLDIGVGDLDSPHGDLDRAVIKAQNSLSGIWVSSDGGPGGAPLLDNQGSNTAVINIPRDKVICTDNGDGTQTCVIIGDDPNDQGSPVQIYSNDILDIINRQFALNREWQQKNQFSHANPGRAATDENIRDWIAKRQTTASKMLNDAFDNCLGEAYQGYYSAEEALFGYTDPLTAGRAWWLIRKHALWGVGGEAGRFFLASKFAIGTKLTGAGLLIGAGFSMLGDVRDHMMNNSALNNRVENCKGEAIKGFHSYNLPVPSRILNYQTW